MADLGASFQQGKTLGDGASSAIFSGIGSGAVSGKIPAYGSSPAEAQLFQGGQGQLISPGIDKTQNCGSYTPGSDKIANQECEAVNFLARNPRVRPRFNITSKDPMVISAKSARNKPASISGTSHQQCRVERVKNPATYTEETCTETQTLENLNCKRVLKVACDPERDGCDQGGIVPNSWVGDMATNFTPGGAGNYILQFGTIADNYWRGWGTVYDRNLTFDIRDVGLITRFALTRAAFDDWLMVRVNGNLVYVGPYGGDRLEIYSPPPVFQPSSTRECRRFYNEVDDRSWVCYDKTSGWGEAVYNNVDSFVNCSEVSGGLNCTPSDHRTGMVWYCATCFSSPELSTSWDLTLNIDLRPHLRNGLNTIFMRTIVAGKGEGGIQITTRQLCPRNCYDQWDNSQCAQLEQMAQ